MRLLEIKKEESCMIVNKNRTNSSNLRQWHPAFFADIQIELESERECRDLSAGYRRQYLLSDLEGERKTVGKKIPEYTGGRVVGSSGISFLYQLQQRMGMELCSRIYDGSNGVYRIYLLPGSNPEILEK